jgi:hypothetical protein
MKRILFLIPLLAILACNRKTETREYRMLQKIEFKNIQWTNGTQPWDSDSTGPDFYMLFGPPDSLIYSSIEKTDAIPFDFPYTYTLRYEVKLSNNEWTFQVFDADDGDDQLMGEWKLNPFSQDESPIHLTSTNGSTWDINLQYEKVLSIPR